MLLEPGTERSGGITDDRAVLQAMLDVETAWVRVQHRLGLVDDGVVTAVTTAAKADRHDLAYLRLNPHGLHADAARARLGEGAR